MIGTLYGSLVGLSRGLPLGSPLESQNSGADLHDTLMGTPIGLWFGSEAVSCLNYYPRLMDFHEATCWAVRISCIPTSEAFITSKINSVRYFQLMELPNL